VYIDREFRIREFPRTPKQEPEPGLGDDIACVRCGAVALDTGLECDECGFDNYESVYGYPFMRVFYNNELGTWEYQVHFIDKTVLIGYGQCYEDTLAIARREAYRLDCELNGK